MRLPFGLGCFLFCLSLMAGPSDSLSETNGSWISLFDGKTLYGWAQRGGQAKYSVEKGEIIGRSEPGEPNSFLCTVHDYTNFVLVLEFKAETGVNSGVQIRSQSFENATSFQWNGKTYRVPARRVHGLQAEIDTSQRSWTAGLYDESARGWLYDLKANPKAREAYKAEVWNDLRIECRGDSIKTWLNGVPAADLKDSRVASGFVALQVHSVGKAGKVSSVRFRNLRLMNLP